MAGNRCAFYSLLWILALAFLSDADDTCPQKLWCSDCITALEQCAWCNQKDFDGTRCHTVEKLKPAGCTDIKFPNNTMQNTQDDDLRDGSTNYDPIQIAPQQVQLTLRPGKTLVLDMKYKVAANLPIDMYFVLDFSTTMKGRIQQLADLTKTLIEELQNQFTQNINIGFGSFLDKPIQPFHITTKQHLENPCILQDQKCDPSYGYIHRKRLNNDINKFIATIRNANTSANFDPMEGGLDAVMQAAVCPDIIGWRNKSRRVLVYISDSGFHFAGDAKLAGIDTPNDGVCHMQPFKNSAEEYEYTHSTTLDYPSFGHLKKVLSENNINAIFIVEQNDKKIYEGLTSMIGTQAMTATMESDSAVKIVGHIVEYYKDLSKKVEITADNVPPELDIIAETNCTQRTTNTFDLRKSPIICTELTIGNQVYIKLSVTAKECPKDKKTVRTVQLIPSGLQESLTLNIDYICDCECKTSPELNYEKCTLGNGTYECGVCRCNEGRSGETCQCDNTDSSTDLSIDEANCKRNNESKSVCEDIGACKCGQCSCPKDFGGKYCECDNSKCIAPGGSTEKCTSKNQGDCVCGTCACKSGYQGKYCECPVNDVCLAKNNKECSGNGQCECGTCKCNLGYNGTFCDTCHRCDNCRKCGNEAQQKCIMCLDNHRSVENSTYTKCLEDCASIQVKMVAKFSKDEQPCGTYDKEQCQISYMITCDSSTVQLHLANTKLCSNPPDPVLIAMPVLGGIIGVGLLLLIIWKILTSFYDKIEYARFEHEIKNPKWSKTDNPIYRTPLTSNQNPVYKGNVDE